MVMYICDNEDELLILRETKQKKREKTQIIHIQEDITDISFLCPYCFTVKPPTRGAHI